MAASASEHGQSGVSVHGLVAQPRVFTRDDLVALPQVTRSVRFLGRKGAERTVTYTGPTLLDVVKAAGGVVEQERLDRLRTCLDDFERAGAFFALKAFAVRLKGQALPNPGAEREGDEQHTDQGQG